MFISYYIIVHLYGLYILNAIIGLVKNFDINFINTTILSTDSYEFNSWLSAFIFTFLIYILSYLNLYYFEILTHDQVLYLEEIVKHLSHDKDEFFIIKITKKISLSIESFLQMIAIFFNALFYMVSNRLSFILPIAVLIFKFITFDINVYLLYLFSIVLIIFIWLIIVWFSKTIAVSFSEYNFPPPYSRTFTFLERITYVHKKLNNDKHIVLLIDKYFSKHLYNNYTTFKTYITNSDYSSAMRVLWLEMIKTFLRLFYKSTKPFLKLLKSKYLYYILMPFVKFIIHAGYIFWGIIYNFFVFFRTILLTFLYHSSILFWMSAAIFAAFFVLMINYISFHILIEHYTELTVVISLALTYLFWNGLAGLFQYVILYDYHQYISPNLILTTYLSNKIWLYNLWYKMHNFLINMISFSSIIYITYNLIVFNYNPELFNSVYTFVQTNYQDCINYLMAKFSNFTDYLHNI